MHRGNSRTVTILFYLLIIRTLPFLQSQELDLKNCIEIAQQENMDIVRDALERSDAWKRVKLQIRLFFPELALSFSQSDSVNIGAVDSRIKKMGLSFNQLLFNGGRDLAAYRSSLRDMRLRDLASEDLLDTIAHSVSLEYVEILKNREILRVQKQSLSNLEEQIEIARLEFELGSLKESDLLDIKIRAVQYSLNIQDTEERLLQSRFNLAELMNTVPAALQDLKGELNLDYRGVYSERILSDPDYLTYLKGEALDFSKELMAFYLQEINAERKVLDSRISWIPRIEAAADLNIAGESYPLRETSFSFALNFSFDTPLFPGSLSLKSGKSNSHEHHRAISSETGIADNMEGIINPSIARNELRVVRLETEELRRQIGFRVESLVQAILLSSQRCDISRQKISLESEKLSIERMRMEMGELTRLDYVKSEIRLANHKTDLIEGIADLYRNEIELEMNCGKTGAGGASLIRSEEEIHP